MCHGLQHAHSAPECALQPRSGKPYPRIVPYRKYMHDYFKIYYILLKNDISPDLCFLTKDLWGGDSSKNRTNSITVKASLNWIKKWVRSVVFVSSGMKKALVISEWVIFIMKNATCLLHGCFGWVRHLWPSGDWEPAFACQESRSKQAQDRPRWSLRTLHAELGDISSHDNINIFSFKTLWFLFVIVPKIYTVIML